MEGGRICINIIHLVLQKKKKAAIMSREMISGCSQLLQLPCYLLAQLWL